MKSFFRVMLGRGSEHAARCHAEKFIGVHFGIDIDLNGQLTNDWPEFNKKYIPIYLKKNPDKSNRAAGLACATIWMVSKGMKVGDIIISPDGDGNYLVGEIVSEYDYHPDEILPHRRQMKWFSKFPRSSMSEALRNSTGSIGTYATIRNEFVPELERLIGGQPLDSYGAVVNAEMMAASFAFEKHLEDFLIQNWEQTELGKKYDLYVDENEDGVKVIGKQIQTDTGRIDILAISKDKKEFLVIELKNNRASDQAVGQVQRYMGYVVSELAGKDQQVKGLIIAMEDDLSIRRALTVAPNIEFWRYEVSFKLAKV